MVQVKKIDDRVKIFRYAWRNEVEVVMRPGDSIDAYNAQLAYSRGDIKSTKKLGSLRKIITRAIADEDMLLRTYVASPTSKGGLVRLYHEGAGVLDTHAIDLPSGHSILLNDDDLLMMADTGLVLKNDISVNGIWTKADTMKPRLDNPTFETRKVYVVSPKHETISIPTGDYMLINPQEFLFAVIERPSAYRIAVNLGLMSLNRVMIEVIGPATVYRRVPDPSDTERINHMVPVMVQPPSDGSPSRGSPPPPKKRTKTTRKTSRRKSRV